MFFNMIIYYDSTLCAHDVTIIPGFPCEKKDTEQPAGRYTGIQHDIYTYCGHY